MKDIRVGRTLARHYVTWGVLSLLVAGSGLSLVGAYLAADSRQAALSAAAWQAHAWATVVGWIAPVLLGLLGWILPLLKRSSYDAGRLQRHVLGLLAAGTLLVAAPALLEPMGRSSDYVLAIGWLLCLAATAGYCGMAYRLSVRSLTPSAADLGIQSGLVWLAATLLLRLAAAVGIMVTGRSDFMAASEPGVWLGAVFGFAANLGLGLAAALLPEFLRMPHTRPHVRAAFGAYNGLLAPLVVGFMWCLPNAYSWGRLPLIVCALGFLYATLHLMSRLQLGSLVFPPNHTRRQRAARLALGTAAFWLLTGALVATGAAAWLAGFVEAPPPALLSCATHLVAAGFFGNLVLALGMALLGPTCLQGLRGWLSASAYLLTNLWLLAGLAAAVLPLGEVASNWHLRGLAGITVGIGSLCLGLWLLWGFAHLDRREPGRE